MKLTTTIDKREGRRRPTSYDSKFYEIKMPETIPMIGQERSYTSPIWYTPCAPLFDHLTPFQKRRNE